MLRRGFGVTLLVTMVIVLTGSSSVMAQNFTFDGAQRWHLPNGQDLWYVWGTVDTDLIGNDFTINVNFKNSGGDVVFPKTIVFRDHNVDGWGHYFLRDSEFTITEACATIPIPGKTGDDRQDCVPVVTNPGHAPYSEVPSLTGYGLAVLMLMLLITGAWMYRKKRAATTA